MEDGRRRRIEHPLVHQVVLGFFLRVGVVPAARAQRGHERQTVHAGQMVGLSSASHKTDGIAAVLAADGGQPTSDLRDGLVPTDAVEAPVLTAAQGMFDSLGMIDGPGNARCLAADVAGAEARFVGTKGGDAAVLDVDEEPAVVAAENADRGEVLGGGRQRLAGNRGVDLDGRCHLVCRRSACYRTNARPDSARPRWVT